MSLAEIGIHLGTSKVKKIKPHPKHIKVVKKIVDKLNEKYYKRETKYREEIVWYAFLPWSNNHDKKWYFLCTSIPLAHSEEVKKRERVYRKAYPNLSFEFASLYGQMYFPAIEHEGTYL